MIDGQNAFPSFTVPLSANAWPPLRGGQALAEDGQATMGSAAFWRSISAPPALGRDGGMRDSG
jgi:hypothetical protein